MSDSFLSLHAMRETKNAKSFVKESSSSGSSLPVPDEPSQTPADAAVPTLVPSPVPIPSNLEVNTTQRSGRALRSRSHQKPGDVLIKTHPHIAVLSTPYLDAYCSSCFAPTPEAGLKRCTQCRVVYYCDSKCQTKDWPLHKNECTALQAWASTAPSEDLSIPSDAVRSLGRILWRKQKRGIDSDWAKEIDSMQSHRAALHPSTHELHTHLSYSLVRYLSLSSPDQLKLFGLESTSDLVDLISRFTANTFTLTTPTLTPIGSSISPLVALINHSCTPNAAVVFPGKPNGSVMQVTALREILPGEEIVTSYIDTTVSRLQRRRILQETYNFTCECSLCEAEGGAQDLREVIWCPQSCGGTCLMPTKDSPIVSCTRCGSALVSSQSEAVLDALRLGQEGLEKATALQTSDPQKALKLTTHLTPFLLSAGLTPASHPLLALSRLHQSFLIDSLSLLVTTKAIPKEGNGAKEAQEILDEAIRTAVRNVAGLEGILTVGHPLRGIARAEVGRLLAMDEFVKHKPEKGAQNPRFPPSGSARLRLALDALIKARDELLVGFGKVNEGGTAGREVRDQIAKLERELKYWNMGARAALEDIRQMQYELSKRH